MPVDVTLDVAVLFDYDYGMRVFARQRIAPIRDLPPGSARRTFEATLGTSPIEAVRFEVVKVTMPAATSRRRGRLPSVVGPGAGRRLRVAADRRPAGRDDGRLGPLRGHQDRAIPPLTATLSS